MRHPTFQQIYMHLALDLAQRSTCERLKVGCVITSLDYRQIYAIGYNGNASGFPHRCDHADRPGACGCVHAEANAITNSMAPHGTPKVVFCTHGPSCVHCAKMLVNMGGVQQFYYYDRYRSEEGLEVFNTAGIGMTQVL